MVAPTPRDECIEALREVADELGHSPSRSEYNEIRDSPVGETISRRLGDGSWNDAKEAAGLEVPTEYTKQDCLDGLQKAADMLGKSPSLPEYVELDVSPGCDTIKRRFESWNAAKEEAGLESWDKNPRRLSARDDYFNEIDTGEKAYWVGFLYADGSVKPYKNAVAIQLQASDRPHLEKFVDAIESEYAVSEFVQEGNEKVQTTIGSPQMVEDLLDLGFKPNKIHSEIYPDIPDEWFADFLRGYFDGDGCISTRRGDTQRSFRGMWVLTCSSAPRLYTVKEWFDENGVDGGSVYEYEDRAAVLQYAARHQLARIWELLYPDGDDTTPALSRKKNRLSEFCKQWCRMG